MKRGQITVFVLVGLVVLVIIAFYFYIKEQNSIQLDSTELKTQAIIEEVQSSINDCLLETSKSALLVFGLVGVNKTATNYPVYNKENIPKKAEIEKFISLYIETISSCENEYIKKTFPISSNARINEKSVSIDVKYPVIVEYKNKTIKIDKTYYMTLPLRLGYIMNAVDRIVDSYYKNQKIDIYLLSSFDLKIETVVKEDQIGYIIQDKLEVEPYILIFGVKT